MMEVEVDLDEQGTTVQETGGPIFPLSRVKKIMKADKDVHMCSADAVLLAAFAAVHLPIAVGFIWRVGELFGVFQ